MGLHVLIGAAVGAVVGAGATLARSWLKDEPVDWKRVGAAALGGAATGALATATFGTGLLAGSAATQVGGMALAGAAGGAVEQTTDNVLHDRDWHEGVAESAAWGGALGAAGGAARVVAPSLARAAGRLAPVRAAGRHAQAVYRPVARATSRAAAPFIRVGKAGWGRYMAAMKRWPMRTKVATSGSLTAFADVVSQKLEGKTEWDWKRTAFRTGWSMAISAPVGHYWMVGLDRMIKGTGVWSTIAKVGVDQFLFSPVVSSVFFGSYAIVHDGATPAEAWQTIKSDVPKATMASASVWPAVNFVKFKYIPLDMRIPYGKAFGTVYSVAFGMLFLADDEEPEPQDPEFIGPPQPPAKRQELTQPLNTPILPSEDTIQTYTNAWNTIAQHYGEWTGEGVAAEAGAADAGATTGTVSGLHDLGARYLEADGTQPPAGVGLVETLKELSAEPAKQ